MDDVYGSRATGFRKASRWIGYGGIVAALLAVGVWFLVEFVFKKKSWADLNMTTIEIEIYPLLPVVIAFVVIVIIVAVVLRIVSAVNERRALDAAVLKRKNGNALARASARTISEASGKVKTYLQTAGSFCKEHLTVIIPSAVAVLSLGGLLTLKAKDEQKKKAEAA